MICTGYNVFYNVIKIEQREIAVGLKLTANYRRDSLDYIIKCYFQTDVVEKRYCDNIIKCLFSDKIAGLKWSGKQVNAEVA